MDTAFLTMILYGSAILFVVGYVGNMLSFSNRFMNALVTAIVFAALYGALFYFADPAELRSKVGPLSQAQMLQTVGMAAVLVFIIDFVANMLAFNNRFVNALMTAVVFAALFGGLMYATGGVPQTTTG